MEKTQETLVELKDVISDVLPNGFLLGHEISFAELSIEVIPSGIQKALDELRRARATEFSTLIDITAVDQVHSPKRFRVVYHLLSMTRNQRVRVSIQIDDGEPVPSVTSIYPAANWLEREVFDMFGVLFEGHPDLRRILTDYGFEGHPLRKDFPMTGYKQMRYDEAEKRCVYEPVELVQDYRQFDFLSPWEGTQHSSEFDSKQSGT